MSDTKNVLSIVNHHGLESSGRAYLFAAITNGMMSNATARSTERVDQGINHPGATLDRLKGMGRMMAVLATSEAAQAQVKIGAIEASDKFTRREF